MMKKSMGVNDMYSDTAPGNPKMKNDLGSDTTIGDLPTVKGGVSNSLGSDIGVNIKGLVVNKGKGKMVNMP